DFLQIAHLAFCKTAQHRYGSTFHKTPGNIGEMLRTQFQIIHRIHDKGHQMLIGYARVSKADGSQTTDLQRDALLAAGVTPEQIYEDQASGKQDDRPQLAA